MRIKSEFGRKTYQHIVVSIVPGVVEIPHSMLEPHQVLHGIPGAAGVDHCLPVLADAEGSLGHVGSIPLVDVPLQRAQAGLAAIQLDDPA